MTSFLKNDKLKLKEKDFNELGLCNENINKETVYTFQYYDGSVAVVSFDEKLISSEFETNELRLYHKRFLKIGELKMNNYIISDMGKEIVATSTDGNPFNIARYGVWIVENGEMVRVVETGNNLEELKAKYNTEITIKL